MSRKEEERVPRWPADALAGLCNVAPGPGFKEGAAHNLTSALRAHPHRPANPRLPFALGAASPMGPPGAISPCPLPAPHDVQGCLWGSGCGTRNSTARRGQEPAGKTELLKGPPDKRNAAARAGSNTHVLEGTSVSRTTLCQPPRLALSCSVKLSMWKKTALKRLW